MEMEAVHVWEFKFNDKFKAKELKNAFSVLFNCYIQFWILAIQNWLIYYEAC